MKKILLNLKNKLAFFNVLSKAFIVTLLLIIVPWLVREITIRNTDRDLVNKFDKVLRMIDTVGIDNYIDQDAEIKAFGSYNILKEEFIAIEHLEQDTNIDVIQYSRRIIEDELVDYRVLSYCKKFQGQPYLIEIGKSMNDIYRFQQNLKRFAFAFLLVILLITFIIDISFIRYLLSPLGRIVEKLRLTGHPADFDYTPVHTRTKDFMYLDEMIRLLMRKIEAAFNNEREYISNVSHELLTPVSIIRTKLDNIIHHSTLSAADMIKIVESKKILQRLTQLVRTLLMMSRIENEEYLLNEKVGINGLIKNVISEIEDKAILKQLTLQQKIDAKEYNVQANKELLFVLFYNIINNAIKYTAKGHIKIETAYNKNQYIVKITDTGKGISEDKLAHVFSRFKKFDRGDDGFGLGLALTKKIADYHNINIKIDSTPGQGTTFILKFAEVS